MSEKSNKIGTGNTVTTIDSPLAIILSVRSSLGGLAVLDIGCGAGGLAGQLMGEGARVCGIDPGCDAIAEAVRLVPGALFETAGAEALPFGDGAFDLTVMVNALHHVPPPLMRKALREGVRVLKPAGHFIVIEPLAEGSFFEALRLIEDETEVRNAAQAALRDAAMADEMKLVRTLTYARRESFGAVEHYLARIAAVDPSRRARIERNRAAIVERVRAVAARVDDRLVLDQPAKADIFARR